MYEPIYSPLPIAVEEDFRIGIAPEAISCANKFRTEFPEIVYRSVEDDPERSIRRHHWLAAGRTEVKIDSRR
jgi:hypothetical protein